MKLKQVKLLKEEKAETQSQNVSPADAQKLKGVMQPNKDLTDMKTEEPICLTPINCEPLRHLSKKLISLSFKQVSKFFKVFLFGFQQPSFYHLNWFCTFHTRFCIVCSKSYGAHKRVQCEVSSQLSLSHSCGVCECMSLRTFLSRSGQTLQ